MGQQITDIAYMVIGIGLMSMVFVVGIVGVIKMYKDIRNIKDTE